jgi:hypothetical protein
MNRILSVILVLLICFIPLSYARGSHSSSSGYSKKSSSYSKKTSYKPYKAPKSSSYKKAASSRKHKKNYCATCQRDKNGKIARSEAAKKAFMKQSGYPKGRPGYVIDHIKPLKEGGADDPSNMQWQTKEEAKAKDNWE